MSAAWLAPVIAGATSVLGNLLGFASNDSTNSTNYRIAQMNNEFNANEALKNRQWQESMYEKYQTASAQAGQMREAGLNPNLMMSSSNIGSSVGSGSTASAASAPAMQPYRPDFDMTSVLSLMNQQKIADAQERNLDADTAVKSEEARFYGTKANAEIQNLYGLKAVNDQLSSKYEYDNWITGQSLDSLVGERQLSVQRIKSEIQAYNSRAALDSSQASLNAIHAENLPAVFKYQFAESAARIYELYQKGKLDINSAKNMLAQAAYSEALARGLPVSQKDAHRLANQTISNMHNELERNRITNPEYVQFLNNYVNPTLDSVGKGIGAFVSLKTKGLLDFFKK